jgi:uncharacterized protein
VELKNSFSVSVPVEEAWDVLTDLKRVAPCMPGAQLTGVTGDEYHGSVSVRVGPFAMAYAGTARFLELDQDRYTAVLRAEGREEKGQGTAAATITTVLHPDGAATMADITSNIEISGKAAQFGRSMLADVSGRLLQQFAERLEADIRLSDGHTAASAVAGTGTANAVTAGRTASVHDRPDREIRSERPPSSQVTVPAAAPIDALGLSAQITAERLPDLLAGLGVALGVAGLIREIRPPGSRLLAGATLALSASVALRAVATRKAAT